MHGLGNQPPVAPYWLVGVHLAWLVIVLWGADFAVVYGSGVGAKIFYILKGIR
jgi:hypothetical protein